ncbi:MAG: hypothetical protein J3Q66DRAFT_110664 [Benniella sp.]|nr:MAG: hypothetical protein J3Q66DRAFT_110664 [Benniella sp.]
MAPRNQRMPSMKELQDLLEALDAEGGLDIVGMDETESTNLDDLFEDSYFHAILHNNIQKDSIQLTADTPSETPCFEALTIPKECSWGDDHESLGSRLLVRPGYSAVMTALLGATDPSTNSEKPQSIFMATGSPGVGKSCLVYYLAYRLFEAGHDIVVSDPMFTNAFLDRQYYSCYSPHLEKHSAIFQAIFSAPLSSSSSTSSSSSKKSTWWICDDGFLPTKGTHCNIFITSSTTQAEKAVATMHKKHKLPMPVQFQIPKWSLDEIKAGLIVSLSTLPGPGPSITKEQEVVLQDLFVKFKGSPKKIFTWVKSHWVETESNSGAKSTARSKSNKSKRP